MESNVESKQSPILGYRIPDDVTKEDRDTLNRKIKDIAKARKINYFELFSLWAMNDYLLENGQEQYVKQNIKQTIEPNVTQEILDRLEKLEKAQLELPPTNNIKQTVEQNIKQETNSITLTKEALMDRVKDYHSQGKNSEEIARILTEEKILTLTGKSVWNASTIRDWLKEGRK